MPPRRVNWGMSLTVRTLVRHAPPGIGQLLADLDDALVEELHLVDADHLGLRLDQIKNLRRARGRLRLDLKLVVGNQMILP